MNIINSKVVHPIIALDSACTSVQVTVDMEGKFGLIVKGKKTALPLKDVSVEAEIQGYVLGLESTLKYANESSEPAEVVFRFPLEQSHAVVGLTAIIDGRKIRA